MSQRWGPYGAASAGAPRLQHSDGAAREVAGGPWHSFIYLCVPGGPYSYPVDYYEDAITWGQDSTRLRAEWRFDITPGQPSIMHLKFHCGNVWHKAKVSTYVLLLEAGPLRCWFNSEYGGQWMVQYR